MADALKYNRVLLKISGEGLCAPGGFGVDGDAVTAVVEEIAPLLDMGVQIGLVVGGGNFIRGRDLAGNPHIQPVTADYMGMLATLINALAMQDSLESHGVGARVLSAIPVTQVCEPFSRRAAINYLDAGNIVILAAGTGSPFFTTDMCAALRANEIDAEVLFKATKVDGVFDNDPVTHPDAIKYDTLTYQKVLADKLGVMDLTAISMCMTTDVPIVVFKLTEPGNLLRAVRGEAVGTLITDQ